jgi:dCTP deaminase
MDVIKNKACLSFTEKIEYVNYKTDKLAIDTKEFMLATTAETVKIPSYIKAKVEGRSSIGRMGLFIQNAGHIDPGFEGQITLELFNASPLPILLESGQRICQLVLAEMNYPAAKPYNGKYQRQKGTTGSKINEELRG